MKITEILYLPYSQAQFHFKQAETSEWKGRIIHRVIGALETIPILNYLIALVDLAVKAFFELMPHQVDPGWQPIEIPKTPLLETVSGIEQETKKSDENQLEKFELMPYQVDPGWQPIEIPKTPLLETVSGIEQETKKSDENQLEKFELMPHQVDLGWQSDDSPVDVHSFLKSQKIEIPKTPLLETVLDIEQATKEWDENNSEKGLIYWGSRIKILGEQLAKLGAHIQEDRHKARLDDLQKSYRTSTSSTFKNLKQLLAELKAEEEGKNRSQLEGLQAEFEKIIFPQVRSFDELMSSMGFRDKIQAYKMEWSTTTAKEYGLVSRPDFQAIGFFDFEEDLKTALRFQAIVKQLPEAQDPYGQFLAGFGQRVQSWSHAPHAQTGERSFNSAQDIQQFIQETRPLLLGSYLKQYNIKGFWGDVDREGRSLYNSLQTLDEKPSVFQLGLQIEGN